MPHKRPDPKPFFCNLWLVANTAWYTAWISYVLWRFVFRFTDLRMHLLLTHSVIYFNDSYLQLILNNFCPCLNSEQSFNYLKWTTLLEHTVQDCDCLLCYYNLESLLWCLGRCAIVLSARRRRTPGARTAWTSGRSLRSSKPFKRSFLLTVFCNRCGGASKENFMSKKHFPFLYRQYTMKIGQVLMAIKLWLTKVTYTVCLRDVCKFCIKWVFFMLNTAC